MTIVSDNTGGDVAYAATFNQDQDVYYVRVVPGVAPSTPTPSPTTTPSPTPTATATIPPSPTPTATATSTPTATATATAADSPTPTPTPAEQPLNLSTRMLVEPGATVGI